MDRLALIGVSHRRGGSVALEAWQREFGPEPAAALRARGLAEFAALVTCNRFDIVTALPEGLSAEALRQRLTPAAAARKPYLFTGEAALEQLTRIAASLDSLNPGEDQIQRQVREAYRRAREEGRTGTTTAHAFETALRIAKRMRSEIPLAPVNTSLFSLALPELRARLRNGDRVGILGAGEMATLAARSLQALDGIELLVVNRNAERAAALAAKLGAVSMPLVRFLAEPPPVQALVAATPVADLVSAQMQERMPALKVVVDLGIPRNVERCGRPGLLHLGIDELRSAGDLRREELGERLAAAERLVQELLEEALMEWAERQLAPSIRKLRETYYRTIGDSLPEEEARRLAHRFAHVPLKGLRAVVREHGLAAARTYLNETGLLE